MSSSEPSQSPPVVQLYHFWSSVCSVRCRMALDEKGVKWESKYIDLFKFDQLTPEYLAINPDGVVPTLVSNGQPIRESVIINEFIDDAFPGPSLIRIPQGCYRACDLPGDASAPDDQVAAWNLVRLSLAGRGRDDRQHRRHRLCHLQCPAVFPVSAHCGRHARHWYRLAGDGPSDSAAHRKPHHYALGHDA